MRVEGTLTKWNDERGFGFITPANGGREVFVHVSAFPRDGQRPSLGERVTFETEAGKDGRLQARNLVCPSRPAPRVVRRPEQRTRREKRSAFGPIIALAGVVALAIYGYGEFSRRTVPVASVPTTVLPAAVAEPESASPFRCDGRQYCSQMTSCAEARYFLKHCPGVEMDGNNDGEPCEQQWCTSPFAK